MSSEKTSELVNSKNYLELAQLYAIINDGDVFEKRRAIEQILKQNLDIINYRVPHTQFITVVQPQLLGCTVLHFALHKRDLEVFNQLLEYGVNLNVKDNEGVTVLHRAIQESSSNEKKCWELKGKLDNPFAVSILSAHVKFDDCTNPCNKDGISNLHIACMVNHVEAIKFFVKNGIPLNQAVNVTSSILPGYTALHFAARYCSVEAAEMLLNYGADPCQTDAVGLSPLHILIERTMTILDYTGVQKKQLCYKFEIELADNRKMIKILFEKMSADSEADLLHYVESFGLTALHIACILNDILMVEKAITKANGVDNCIDKNSSIWAGYTPLHFAAHVDLSIVMLLVEHSASMNARDINGVTPFNLCMERFGVEAAHFIVANQPSWQSINFSDDVYNSSDFTSALQNKNLLFRFLAKIKKVLTIPVNSPLWPGYSILHLAVVFCDRGKKLEDLFSSSDYIENNQLLLILFKDNCKEEREKGYFQRIKYILSINANLINETDVHNSTPLHLAFCVQNRSLLKLLLGYHEKIKNIVNENGLSHFHIACAMRSTEVAKKLLKLGADVNSSLTCDFDYLVTDGYHSNPQVFLSTPRWTPLHLAVVTANFDLAEALLKYGADIFALDGDGLTPVHRVLQLDNRYDIGVILLSANDLKDCVTCFGLSFLHVACYVGHEDAVKNLLDLGTNIEAVYMLPEHSEAIHVKNLSFLKKFADLTPLQIAMINHRRGVANLLIKRGANVFAKQADGRIMLSDRLSSDSHFRHFFYKLLGRDNKKFVIHLRNTIGLTQFHTHCFHPDEHEVMSILKFIGADPNVCIHSHSPIWSKKTALHFVIMNMIHTLTYEADEISSCFNSPAGERSSDQSDNSASWYANLQLTVEWLLQYGADVTLTDANQLTPVHLAAELLYYDEASGERDVQDMDIDNNQIKRDQSKYRFPSYLVAGQKNFSINPISPRGMSHFDVACACNEVDTVKQFLEHGLDVNRPFGYFDKRYAGFTPLHLAAYHKSRGTVMLLLKYGANVHARDSLGNTPLHVAADYCHRYNNADSGLMDEEIFEILIEHGADVDEKNAWGETPLGVFLRSGVMTLRGLEILVCENNCCINVFNVKNGKGFLAEAIPRYHTDKFITNRQFYKSVINNPLKNNCDEVGRTVLHNIVSIDKANISYGEYVAAIGGFIKTGFNVDHQDEKGRTALHAAVRFENYNGIGGLLENGADVNLSDLNGESAFTFSEESFETDEENKLDIFNIFSFLIYKLDIAGLKVSAANRRIATQLNDHFFLDGDDKMRCNAELDLLKAQKICENATTWFDLLSYTNASLNTLQFRHHAIAHIFEKKIHLLHKQFPLFAGLLIMQYRKIRKGIQLIEPAKNSLNFVVGFKLPELCSELIFEFLSSRDLENLIRAIE